ncbi:CRIB domain-containing protein RIC8 [Cardamine amara subsp. amara]|uniref:CRIB domain-containing protein RIC8 n=1 Tax=Cardamine amara subsp. amara TaxID=228776 RepID=A0ABD0ZNC7_CARAN
MSNYKMKSLFKGLRYISQMFENEKEPEMQIGTPTDVKHVAHIGWDGGSVNQNAPSWMNDFKASSGYSSSPMGNIKEDASCISQDSTRSRDRPGLPKSSRDRSNTFGLPTKEQRPRRGSSNSSVNPKSSRRSKESSGIPQDGSRKSRRKKSKDTIANNGGSSRSSRRTRGSQTESISGSISDAGSMISISNDI